MKDLQQTKGQLVECASIKSCLSFRPSTAEQARQVEAGAAIARPEDGRDERMVLQNCGCDWSRHSRFKKPGVSATRAWLRQTFIETLEDRASSLNSDFDPVSEPK
jgi:hypothetical protein